MTGAYRPLVLCYHAVSDGWEHDLSVGPEELEWHVATLVARGWRGGDLDDVLANRPVLHATFDDAYRTTTAGLAILRTHGVGATVFAATAFADDGAVLRIPELAADAAAVPHELETMTWDELRELADGGVEIGSHTVSHPHLPRLSDEELERELTDSRARAEDMLGRPCRVLAYPYGDEDARVRAVAQRAGYAAAFGLPGREDAPDPFALPRVGIYRGDSRLHFALKTRGPVRRAAAAALRAVGRRP